MTLSVVTLVIVLVFVMLGYQFNSNDGRIEQGGLVQFDSQPSGASVTIDGNSFGTQTTSKTTMTAGQHFITMNRAGYNQWQKSVTVVPGAVLWLNYARLVPTNIEPKDMFALSMVSSVVASPDNESMAIKDDPTTPIIKIADLTREDARMSDLSLPSKSFTVPDEGKSQRFTIASWDPDSKYLLVKHTYNDDANTEWIVVDTNNVNESKNVTTLLDINASKLLFSNADSSVLYALIDSDVRKINLNDATLSRPLVVNVADFDLYSDSMVTYTSLVDASGKRTVGYYIDGTQSSRVVKTVDDSSAALKFTVGRYFNETFEAIAIGDTVEVLSGDLPRDSKTKLSLKTLTSFTVSGGVQYLSDQTNGRFIVAQSGATYATYDLELEKMTTTTLKGSSVVSRELLWLDKYHVWSDRDGMLRFYEFDGANQQDVMKVVPGMSVALNPNGKYLYGITKSDDGKYHLSRVQMIIN